MRTTLTLDDDLAAALKEQARRADQPFKQVVNDTLRRGLSPALAEAESGYQVTPHDSGLRPGVDPWRLNHFNDSEVHSNDNDFARLPGLRWRNPL